VAITTSHHAATSAASTAIDGSTFRTPLIRPAGLDSSRVRQTRRAHGVSGNGSTTIVIWPLGCAVQSNV
jgi:hypothetical protein